VVLLVEEEELLRRALERHLGEQHHVSSFATMADALTALEGAPFDAAVLAFPRPESFGLRLLGRLAEAAPALARNTVVMVPTGLKAITRDKLVSLGVVILPRPVDFTTLRSVVLRLLPNEELALGEG
jgi:DNA-binding NtrC family response regulator